MTENNINNNTTKVTACYPCRLCTEAFLRRRLLPLCTWIRPGRNAHLSKFDIKKKFPNAFKMQRTELLLQTNQENIATKFATNINSRWNTNHIIAASFHFGCSYRCFFSYISDESTYLNFDDVASLSIGRPAASLVFSVPVWASDERISIPHRFACALTDIIWSGLNIEIFILFSIHNYSHPKANWLATELSTPANWRNWTLTTPVIFVAIKL